MDPRMRGNLDPNSVGHHHNNATSSFSPPESGEERLPGDRTTRASRHGRVRCWTGEEHESAAKARPSCPPFCCSTG